MLPNTGLHMPDVVDIVVTAANVHYAAIRSLGAQVRVLATGLGPSPLITAYDAVARPLGHLLHESEEVVIERVQLLHAQGRLVPGAMAASFETWRELQKEWASQFRLLASLENEISNAADDAVTKAIGRFAVALRACLFFEAHIAVALAPYLEEHQHHDRSQGS